MCAQLTTKYVESPSANLAPRRSTYIHKLAARLLIRPAPRSSHKLAPSVGTSWRLYYRIPSIQAFCRGSKHSPSKCQRQRRARTLSQSAPRTVEQPQACTTKLHGGSVTKPNHQSCECVIADGKHSPLKCQRQRRARTLSPPLPRTVEQPQACTRVRPIGASCVCNQMYINCTVVSQARPHKSVNTQLVPHGGRSSVNPDRILPSSESPPAPTQNRSFMAASVAKPNHLQL